MNLATENVGLSAESFWSAGLREAQGFAAARLLNSIAHFEGQQGSERASQTA